MKKYTNPQILFEAITVKDIITASIPSSLEGILNKEGGLEDRAEWVG